MASSHLSEQDQASMTGPRAMKEPGDSLWCWQTISALQSMWKGLILDVERYLETWKEAEEYRVWEKVPYENPYGSKEAMLEKLALGDDAAARSRVAIQAMPSRPQRKSSRNDVLTNRIARERPDILERMQRGEFTSVSAAAREAGIQIRRTPQVSVGEDKEKLAKTLRDIVGPEEFRKFAAVVIRLVAEDEAGT